MRFTRIGRQSEAIEEYKESIRIRPNTASGHLGLGDVYYNTRQYALAVTSYREGVRMDAK